MFKHLYSDEVYSKYTNIRNCTCPHIVDKVGQHRSKTCFNMFRLFECFMESAPQLVLQIYILIKDPHAIRLMDDGNRFVEGKRGQKDSFVTVVRFDLFLRNDSFLEL